MRFCDWIRRSRVLRHARSMRDGLEEAQRRLDEVHAQDEEITSMAQTLKKIRQVNGLAPRFAAAMREDRWTR